MSKKDEALKLALEWYDSGKEDRQEFEALMKSLLPEQPAQSLPFGVGGGLVAIKTLLSRDPCAHAKVAIEMIDSMLTEQPAPPECQTEAEKTAFAFGWWKALESVRQPAQQPPKWQGARFDSALHQQPAQQQERKTSYEELERIADDLQELCDKQAIRLGKLEAQHQEPVAYAVYHRMGGSKSLHWPENHSEDGDHNEYQLVPLCTSPQPSKPWVGLTPSEIEAVLREWDYHAGKGGGMKRLVSITEAKLKERNT